MRWQSASAARTRWQALRRGVLPPLLLMVDGL